MEKFLNNIPKEIKYKKKIFEKGSYILSPLRENDSLFILLSGEAQVYRESYKGGGILVSSYKGVDFFGELEVFSDKKEPFSIIATSRCEVMVFSRENIILWMKKDFNFALHIIERISKKLTQISEETAKLLSLTIRERYLYSIRKHYDIGNLDNLSKNQIVKEVNAPLRSLNRAILECSKIVAYKNKKFEIINLKSFLEESDIIL